MRIVTIMATWIPALMIIASGVGKLVRAQPVVEGLTKLGVGPYLTLLGIMEIVFAVLFIFPQTMKIGFILCSCYFAGAVATELSHGVLAINPFIPLVLLWIGAFIRDKSIFLAGSRP